MYPFQVQIVSLYRYLVKVQHDECVIHLSSRHPIHQSIIHHPSITIIIIKGQK
jgi:hypothetical protein